MPIHGRKTSPKSGLQQLEDSLCHQVLELHEKLQLLQRKNMALRNLALKHQVNILRGEESSGINLKAYGLPQCDGKAQEKLKSDLQAAAKVCGIHITKVDSNFTISDDDLKEVWDVEGELRSHTFKISFIREGKVGSEANNMKIKEISRVECLPHHQKLDEMIAFVKEVPQPYIFFMGLFSLQELMEERTKAENMLEESVPDLVIQKGTEPLRFSYLPSADLVINFEWDIVWNRINLFCHNIKISCTEEVKARYSQKSEILSVLQQESLDSPVILMEFFEKFD